MILNNFSETGNNKRFSMIHKSGNVSLSISLSVAVAKTPNGETRHGEGGGGGWWMSIFLECNGKNLAVSFQ